MPVILWTDALIFLLLTGIAGYFYYVSRRPQMRATWMRVTESPSGMSALVVLLAFLLVGLLDSIHYRPALDKKDPEGKTIYSVEVLSLLDAIADPLRKRQERTYSAPFDTRAYSKETIEIPGADGTQAKQVREFPRLKHGGVHLKNEAERDRDVLITALRGFSLAFATWLAIAVLLAAALTRGTELQSSEVMRRIWRGETRVPWREMLLILGVLMAIGGPLLSLCTQYHVLGTDKVGQDVLLLALKSIRTGLVIGTLTTLVVLPLAVAAGITAGYFRGWIDDVVQYIYTTLNSIPGVLLIAASVLLMQVYIDTHPELFPTAVQRADLRLVFLCGILGLTSWTGLARLLRGEVLKLRELEYVQAAQAFGVGHAQILARHILPNVMHVVLISLVLEFSGLVLAEAVLSYVGVGVDPSMTSFGTMINAARLEMGREPMVWWSLAAAFVFMFVLVLAANLFADAVRDAFDPRVRVRGPAMEKG
ncbi:MAG: ABC transporter permease [Burkholderiales bacterium]